MEGAIVLDAAAVEYWRTVLAKFYGGARIMLEEESSNHGSRYRPAQRFLHKAEQCGK
jgi:hypothetical protein